MIASVIFPTICIFILILSMLKFLEFPSNLYKKIFFSLLLAGIFFGSMMMNPSSYFDFLYFSNFISVLILIPCLTYLISRLMPRFLNKYFWLRLFTILLFSTIITLIVFGISFFFLLANNPMDYARH